MIIQKLENGNWTATYKGLSIEAYSRNHAIYWGLLELVFNK